MSRELAMLLVLLSEYFSLSTDLVFVFAYIASPKLGSSRMIQGP